MKPKRKMKKAPSEKVRTIFGCGRKCVGVLATVDELRDSTINVDVENDVVTLKGTVGSKAEQEAAVKAAKSVDGVKNVKDMLKVDAKDSMTNQATSDSDKDGKAATNKK